MRDNIFDKQVALVTGGAKGIGSAIALALGQLGADVAIVDVHLPGAKEVATSIEEIGHRSLALEVNVAKPPNVQQAFREVMTQFGRLDILVNNAGIIQRGTLREHNNQDWQRVMAVNCWGTYLCSREAAEIMRQQEYGRIINISSVAGKVGDITSAPSYGPSKGAVNALTKSLARELAPFGITVNAVAPHAIETDMSSEWPPEKHKAVISQIPLGRLGRPEEVAEAVVFLASPLTGFITGEILDINGGYLMD